jgi:hypothetical protein
MVGVWAPPLGVEEPLVVDDALAEKGVLAQHFNVN